MKTESNVNRSKKKLTQGSVFLFGDTLLLPKGKQ